MQCMIKKATKVELLKTILALVDRKLDINKYFYEVEENEIIFSNLDIKQLEKTFKRISSAMNNFYKKEAIKGFSKYIGLSQIKTW